MGIVRIVFGGVLVLAPSVIHASTGPHINSATTGTAPVDIVHKSSSVQAFITASTERRVDIAGIGDSNQLFGGTYGHDHGVQKAWADVRGMYATGVLPFGANNLSSWSTSGVNYHASALGGGGWSSHAPPTDLASYVLPNSGFPDRPYVYLADNESLDSGATHYQLNLPIDTPFDTSGAVRWHYTYGTFPNGNGSFRPTARQEATLNILGSKSVNPVTGTFGLSDDYLELPAAARNFNVGFEPFTVFDGAVEGPFFAQYQRAESVDVSHGIAYSTLLPQGGKAALHAAQSLQGASDTALGEWLRQTVRLQQGDPMLMVNVIHGGNDRNYSDPSVGPNPAPSNTGAGFADNLEAIVTRVRTAWSGQGYDVEDLFFTIGAYHPQQDFRSELSEFEEGAMALADRVDNIAVIRGSKLISARTMRTRGYYVSHVDDAHLSRSGYENFDRLAVTQLVSIADLGINRSNVSSFGVVFDASVSASLDPGDLLLKDLDSGMEINVSDLSVDYDDLTGLATWTFPGLDGAVLPIGRYRATLDAEGITDAAGNPLNGGLDFNYDFDAIPEPGGAILVGAVCACLTLRLRLRR